MSVQDDHHRDPNSVYQKPDEPAPRAFFVDVWNEDTDSTEHYYYAVTHPDGDGASLAGSRAAVPT